uniref:Uncharacterized protein n=1 Tax=Rhizophora mucronata TaxID=61149 RepID=A0A2P2PDJ2_RHIMU
MLKKITLNHPHLSGLINAHKHKHKFLLVQDLEVLCVTIKCQRNQLHTNYN